MAFDDFDPPASSSPLKEDFTIESSSPLKPETQQKQVLRDKFSFVPNLNDTKDNTSDTNSSVPNPDDELKKLTEEFNDFSHTLVQAVFKSNSMNADLARERLNGIRRKRTSWSWSASLKKEAEAKRAAGQKNARLPSIKNDVFGGSDNSSKITVDKQRSSIFDRYSSVLNQSSRLAKSTLQVEPSRPTKRRLIRADALEKSNPTQLDKAKNKMLNLRAAKVLNDKGSDTEEEEMDMSDEDISGDEYRERVVEVNIDEQILTFINTAEVTDIANLSECTIDKANVIISQRPFGSLSDFASREFLTEKEREGQKSTGRKRGRGASKKKESERLIEKISQSIRGYNAIDSLIKKCATFGNNIASQIKRWGIDIEKVENGSELDFMDVSSDAGVVEGFDESEVSEAPTPSPSLTQLDSAMKLPKQVKVKNDSDSEFEDDGNYDDDDEEESEDEEYGITLNRRRRQVQIGRIAGINRNKIIKYFKGKPRLLSPDISLKDYQQTGLNWLNLLYHNQMSCILADDMGLGKTCQVISFLAYLKQINQSGPHLVIVPSSTLENWLREFQKFAPVLKIEPYYGSQQERADLRDFLEQNDGNYDVIVTTYNLAAGNKYDVSFLKSRSFNVIVYDEGHMLKNSMTDRFAKLMKIQGNFRLLLTGTPLQNNLRELMSLLEFIMPSLFESKKESLAAVFKQRAKTTDNNKDYNPLLAQEAIQRAKTMLRPFILRRHKDQVLKHLPKKHLKLEFCTLHDSQKAIYNSQINMVLEHRRMVKDGILPKDKNERAKIQASTSNNLIMALRKASNHPLLFRHIYNDEIIAKMSDAILDEPQYAENGNREYIREDMSFMSDFELHNLCCNFPRTLEEFQLKNNEWMDSGKVDMLIKVLKSVINERQEKILIFSQFTQVLDILEKVLSTLDYKFLRLDGSTQVNDRQSLIDKFYEDKSIPIFILSTKAGGFGINLVCANNVVIFDQSFNPHDDRQAADRAHRVGQTKEVNVVSLITKDTIDEKIYELAKNKLALDQQISEDDTKAKENLDSKVTDMLEDIIYEENAKKDTST